ncbi:MAG: site-specific integrase [Acetobacteraceae bacterium]|nr:site-specific integrase [Acetobacteraceae bacterium]
MSDNLHVHSPSWLLEQPAGSKLPNAADALVLIGKRQDLSKARRVQLATAIRKAVRICRPELGQQNGDKTALQHAAQAVPMDCGYLNERLFHGRAKANGLEDASFNNLVSRLRDALRLLDRYSPDLPTAGELSPPWRALYGMLSSERRKGLITFFGYCDGIGLKPTDMAQKMLEDFVRWTRHKTLHRDPDGRGRRVASNWEWARQNLDGWPDVKLTRSGMRDEYTLPLESYPASFRRDVEAYLDRYACRNVDELFPDKVISPTYKSFRSRRRPLSPRSVETRRYQIRQAAAALVIQGTPAECITSLRDLVSPREKVKSILIYHRARTEQRRRNQEAAGLYLAEDKAHASPTRGGLRDIRTSNLAGIGEMLRQIATFHCGIAEEEIDWIRHWISKIKPPQQTTMTEKNTLRLRKLLDPQIYAQIIHYPANMMQRAESPKLKPQTAARLALYAVAFEILTICPMRRGNLAGLRLDKHLIRPRPNGPFTYLHIPADEVKNNREINWPIPAESDRLIQVYMQKHRHHLAEPGNPFLFPGKGQRGRSGHDLGVGLTERFERDIGAEFNTHVMRHLAVIRFLIKNPGQYEIVQRILGHAKVTTTMAFYSGPEMDHAVKLLAKVIQDDRQEFKNPAMPFSPISEMRQERV